jgi:SPP1 family predicted phage head-tail adaptor
MKNPAGSLRHRLKIFNPAVQVTDGIGGGTYTYTYVTTIWGKATRMTGTRALEFTQLIHGEPYDITIRYRDDITIDESTRFTFGNKNIFVHSIEPDDKKQYFHIIGRVDKKLATTTTTTTTTT